MHYHGEIWIQNKGDVDRQINEIMAKFSFYDAFSIGGRWTGIHDDYDPTKDERNYKTCSLCNGTGDRPGWVCYDIDNNRKFYSEWAKICNGCNGCKGIGKMLIHPSLFVKHEQDTYPVPSISEKLTAHTLIVKDKLYNENGNWGGITFNGDIKQQLKKLGIKDGYLVTIDFHR